MPELFFPQSLRLPFLFIEEVSSQGHTTTYDLLVFDEFHEPEGESTIIGATEAGTAFANTLLKTLDGQQCRLDSKYARVFTKTTNVPIIMIANNMPRCLSKEGPFQERFMRLRFQSNLWELKEERVIATLWGCIKRRVNQIIQLQRDNMQLPNLKYNAEMKSIEMKWKSRIDENYQAGMDATSYRWRYRSAKPHLLPIR